MPRRRPLSGPKGSVALRGLIAFTIFLIAACGGDTADTTTATVGTDATSGTTAAAGDCVVRFAFSPDPVMDYLISTGTLDQLQGEWGCTLEMTEAFDEFAFFAGGHGDVVSTSSHEVAALEQETDIKTVTFGKYNYIHLQLLVRADSDYQTMEDLVGQRVAVGSPGSMVSFGLFAKRQYDVDFTFEGGDYEIILNDHAANPELLVAGDVEASLSPTELASEQWAAGEVRALYDATTSELWRDEYGHFGLMQNDFVATEEFYDSNPRAIAFFLDVWQTGVDLWHENAEAVIRAAPEQFNANSDGAVEWIVGYLDEHDWTVESVYLDQEWIDGEQEYIQLLKDNGFLDPELPATRFEVVTAEDVAAQK